MVKELSNLTLTRATKIAPLAVISIMSLRHGINAIKNEQVL